MSECIVPSWNLSHQRQQVAGEEGNRTPSHVHNQPHPAYAVPMSNYEVAELTWENGQLAMHGLAGILPAPAAGGGGKVPTFVRTGGTLESIVHQATCYNNNEKATQNQLQETAADLQQGQTNPIAAATTTVILDGKRVQNTAGNIQISPPGLLKKRLRSSESDRCGQYSFNGSKMIKKLQEDQVVASGAGSAAERSGCASASATFCRDATMMTWNSFESPGSFKTKTTDEDSACHDGSQENRDEDQIETKEETFRSHSARRSRAAMIHNQSERRRRDRINQKMKALQKLVPNASKTDKASMLDEVIEYLKQLQTQVQMMSTRTMPHMMMNPLAIQHQQQLQMSLLARMGMGMGVGLGMPGMGMYDMNAALARSASSPFQSGVIPTAPVTPTFVPPHFVVPATAVTTCAPTQAKSQAETTTTTTNTTSVPFSDPYAMYLAQVCQQKLSSLNIKQSMNMEFYNKMAAFYRQQATNQTTQATSNQSQENFIQRE